MLRRSRGFRKFPILLPGECYRHGAGHGRDLKSAFAFTSGNWAYMSQYLADMENYKVIPDLYGRQGADGAVFLTASQNGGRRYASDILPLHRRKIVFVGQPGAVLFQHHCPCGVSHQAEHGLNSRIAVIFDGNWLRNGRQHQGGSSLICTDSSLVRAEGNLTKNQSFAAEMSRQKDAALTAVCHPSMPCCSWDEARAKLRPGFPEFSHRSAVPASPYQYGKKHQVWASLFDAVSALLEIQEYNTYGRRECAKPWKPKVSQGKRTYARPAALSHKGKHRRDWTVIAVSLISGTLRRELVAFGRDTKPGKRLGRKIAPGPEIQALALGCHEAAAGMVLEMCFVWLRERFHENKAALGGVFCQCNFGQERCRQLWSRMDLRYM